ncbi:MAG: LPS-assembly protein LptD, partial [Bacteroidia bacterium]|nr:LPS-assembly protein LptD [Bacteroidia bacterium]
YTQEGGGYILASTTKKIDETSYYIKSGRYTTCNLPEPHYSINSNKLKVIQNKKIVTGPAYLTIADVPTPLVIPFGFFPNKSGRNNGIIIPTYGESTALGFYLRDGGYYFGLGDYFDMALTGDIYSLGSWGSGSIINYANRYKYNGSLNLTYKQIRTSDRELPDFALNKEFFIRWNHKQDPKARPNSIFSAQVNAGTIDNFTVDPQPDINYLRNEFRSSISYSKSWPGKPYNFTISANHNQNSSSRVVNVTLPEASFSINRFNPLKGKDKISGTKWHSKMVDNLGVSLRTNLRNQLQATDSTLFDNISDDMQNGLAFTVPISTSLKVFKYFTLSPSVTYNERWYLSTIRRGYSSTDNQIVTLDTVRQFTTQRDFITSASLNTRVYGLKQFKGKKIAAVRHVMSHTLSFNYRPDFSEPKYGYYGITQINAEGDQGTYSLFQNGILGGPPSGKLGSLAYSIDNNLEMKVKPKSDTITDLKKIKILESLRFSTSYNLALDSLNLSNIRIDGRTTLFNRASLSFGGVVNPYVLDTLGRTINTFELSENNRLGRLTSANVSLGFSLKNINTDRKSNAGTQAELDQINADPFGYVDFSVPYNLGVNYSMTYTKSGLNPSALNQFVNFNGDLSLTDKWKITFNSGYDFQEKDFSYTSLGFYRDLHCWEMRLNWIPFGFQQSYNFQINVKSSVLQDLKLVKKTDRYDRL